MMPHLTTAFTGPLMQFEQRRLGASLELEPNAPAA